MEKGDLMKLYLNFNQYAKTGAGVWEDFSRALRFDGFSRKLCFGSDGETEQQTVSMKLEPVMGLEALAVRVLTTPNDIRAKLTQDDGTPYFIGTIRPLVTGSVKEAIKPFTAEILDDTTYLHSFVFKRDSATAGDLKVINADPAKSLIHWLVSQATIENNIGQYVPAFAHADILIDPAIDQNIQAYGCLVNVGDYVDDILNELCYEHNLQYRATEDGKISFVPSVPAAVITGARTLGDQEIKTSLSLKRGDDVNRGALVTYYPVVYGSLKVAQHSVMDGRWSDSKTASRGYEWLNRDEGQYPPAAYQSITLASSDLENSQREILRYDFPTLKAVVGFDDGSRDKSQGIASATANGDGTHRLKINVLNDKTLVKELYATCFCWYVDKELEKTTQVHQGPEPQEYEAKHLHDGVAASKLLKALVLRSTGGNLKYTFKALPSLGLAPGEIVSLAPATLGMTSFVRILSVTDAGGDKRTPLVSVTAEGVTPLSAITVDTSEQVKSILARGGSSMFKITPSTPSARYEPLSGQVSVTASGDALTRLGGSLKWWLNNLPMIETGETVEISHQEMGSGESTVLARVSIPGVDFGDKPLEATCQISLMKDGARGIQGDPGPQGEGAYQTQVISEQGTVFRMGENFSTSMSVHVWQDGVEITDFFTDADFRWRRTSKDEHADAVWNSAHFSTGGKTLTITQEDAVGRSNFFCDLLKKRS